MPDPTPSSLSRFKRPFVKERLLCQHVSQPSGDIPPIEDIENTEPQTNRER